MFQFYNIWLMSINLIQNHIKIWTAFKFVVAVYIEVLWKYDIRNYRNVNPYTTFP